MSIATSINDVGQIVGRATDNEGNGRATLFDNTGAGNNIDLNTIIDPNSGWSLEKANDINNNGWIVGNGINPQGENHAFLLVPISTKYSGGTGEPNNPYQIATAEDLMLLGESIEDYDKHFIMIDDIDLDPNLPGRKVFDRAVIAPDTNDVGFGFHGIPFTGVFNGDGYTISHLTIIGKSYLGLFGQLGEWTAIGDITNLHVVDVNITGTGSYIGSLAGLDKGNIISHCFSNGLVTGSGCVGGLVGRNLDGDIIQCGSSAVVVGLEWVGGLVGSNTGNITGSYNTGAVTGDDGVGGLVGDNPGNVISCYNTGTVRGDRYYIGGLVGFNHGGTILCSYAICTVQGNQDKGGGLVGLNRGQGSGGMGGSGSEAVVSDCYSIVIGESRVYGLLVGFNGGEHLTQSVPSLINNCYASSDEAVITESFGLVGWNHTSRAEVLNCFWDAQVSGVTDSNEGGTSKTTVEMQTASTFLEAGWDFVNEVENGPNDVWKIVEGLDYPRLWWEKYSGGTGDPNNPYRIANAEDLMLLGESPEDYDKHFIMIDDIDLDPNLPGRKVFDRAVIAPDVNDANWWFDGISFKGIFDGNGHVISNLTIEGEYFLGLFGKLEYYEATVSNLGLDAVYVNGRGDSIGGLAGENRSTITDCYVRGSVSGRDFVGGLVGANLGGSIITCSFARCIVQADESGGGLVGLNAGPGMLISSRLGSISFKVPPATISDCYSILVGESHVSGLLVGQNGKEGDMWRIFYTYIDNCYASCDGTGIVEASGLVGTNWKEESWNCFWDAEVSRVDDNKQGGVPLNTSEMQMASTYLEAGWDFVDETENGIDDIWWIYEGKDYPRLWWELIPEN